MDVTAPHQPRLDCQMWFAARAHYSHNHWLLNLVYRLLTQQTEGQWHTALFTSSCWVSQLTKPVSGGHREGTILSGPKLYPTG